MNESERIDKLRHEVSTPLLSGLAFVLFVFFVICAHSLNIISLTLSWHFTMAFLFPVGIICALALSTDVISKVFRPKTAPRKAVLFSTHWIVVAGVVLVFVIGNGTMAPVIFIILFTPILVMSGPIVACTALVRTGVPKVCALFLIASIILAIAAVPIALAIGSDENFNPIGLSVHPEFLCWVVCVAVSIFLCRGSSNGFIKRSSETGIADAAVRRSATVLWALSAALWLVVLHWIVGLTEKGSG